VLTFYNHRGVRITDQWVAIGGRRYPVRELTSVRTTRGPISRVATVAFGAGGSILVLAFMLGPVLPVLMTVGIAVAGLVATAVAVVVAQTKPRMRFVWIDVRGVERLLLATTDEIEVGKVIRALRRAVERDTRSLAA
jgi:hypothetical protein